MTLATIICKALKQESKMDIAHFSSVHFSKAQEPLGEPGVWWLPGDT